jgi:hypothetical protein
LSNELKTTLITRDIKLLIEEEERVRLITMLEKDLLLKTKTNIIPLNID